MMLDIPFSMYLNYVQDQVYNLTRLLFDVYLASSCQLVYHSYDVSQVFFTLTQIFQPTIQTAMGFQSPSSRAFEALLMMMPARVATLESFF